MALLWVDGFDEYGTTTVSGSAILSRKYTVTNASTGAIIAGRFGAGKALTLGNGTWANTLTKQLGNTDATFTVGIACRWTPTEVSEWTFLSLMDSTTDGLQLKLMPDGRIKLASGANIVAISTFTVAMNVWYFFQLKTVCSSATNYTYELRLGDNVLFSGSATNKTGADAYFTGIRLPGFNFKGTWSIDDLYVTNGATGFLGNVRVETLYPTGDSGTIQWTPSANAAHYTLVDENPVDDDTTYVEDSTSGNTDLYDVGNSTVASTLSGIMVCIDARDTVANSTVQIQCVSGATTSNSANLALTTSYMTQSIILENDPNTSAAWTVSDFNAAQFGVIIP